MSKKFTDQLRGVYDATGHLDDRLVRAAAVDRQRHSRFDSAAPEFWGRSASPICSSRSRTPRVCSTIEDSIAAGININVTLLFSATANYEAIHSAFIRRLERRVQQGQPIDDVHSVASFFV